MKTILHNLKQTATAGDQFLFCILGTIVSIFKPTHKVWADETLSAYLWRQHNYWYINIFRLLVDLIFLILTWKKGHCESSYNSEINSSHLPEEER